VFKVSKEVIASQTQTPRNSKVMKKEKQLLYLSSTATAFRCCCCSHSI